jgi:hypothetical protein
MPDYNNRAAPAVQDNRDVHHDAINRFREHCAVAALAYAFGASTLIDLADDCQFYALRSRLVAALGQDAVQAIMAAAFRKAL